jgi:hypothetical protein
MEKTGELKEGVSRCDLCGKPAAVVYNVRALCCEHAESKLASDIVNLKCITHALAEEHTFEPKPGK